MNHTRLALTLGPLALTVALVAQQAPVSDTVINPLANDPSAAAAGQQLFNSTCANCHGQGAVGDPQRAAPGLTNPAALTSNAPGDIFKIIRSGIAGTEMGGYPQLTDRQTWQIVSYIHSLQGGATTGRAATAAAPASVAGTATPVAAGEALFFGSKANCAACHEVNGRGGVVGPDLSTAGRYDAAALRQKITSPNTPMPQPAAAPGAGRGGPAGRGGGPAAVTLIVKTSDGKEIRGVRRNEDTFSVQMMDAAGKLHMFDKTKVASVTVDPKSLMPDTFGTRLTAAEVESLVAYLGAQTSRDPSKIQAQPMTGGLTYERLVNAKAEPGNWPMYWGDYQGTHYSALKEITPANVSRLRPAWTFPIFADGGSVLQGTPLVVDGVMYATGSGNPTTVAALDAKTGRQLWRFTRNQAKINPFQINPFSRGVTMLGNRLYIGTLDAMLICLDARSGRQLWEVAVGDTMEGITITSPPLAVKDKIIVGMSGGEYATRGRLDAYDAASGKLVWRFYTIPGPGEKGNDTWKGDSWQTGGAPTWLTGTYDPELNTVYWPVGNPAAQVDRSVRGDGDNLYSDSVVALDPDTGKLKWHFQFTPNDGHDWDSAQDMVLVDRVWRGQNRKLLLHADRNSHFYVLDRTNGKFLAATPFVYQNWNDGFDENGRPKPRPNSNSSPQGTYLVYPSLGGGTNFQAPSYSALTGWFYLAFSEAGQQFASAPSPITRGQTYIGRGRATTPGGRAANDPEPNSGIKAIDPETGKTVWQFPIFQGSLNNGVMATAGNVLFASSPDGNLFALDSKTGKYLWHFQTNSRHSAAPMSYSVDGKQYVALSAGNVVIAFSLAQ
jgi:PQQ-dependent dehydrogenase (methanol/ethanol family)